MRKLFSRQLIEARHEMLSIYEAVDLALHDAVKAYVTDDRKLATKTKKRTLSIDARCANLEAVCYNLIATQSPVASDFRLLQTIIYVDFNLQRMTDKRGDGVFGDVEVEPRQRMKVTVPKVEILGRDGRLLRRGSGLIDGHGTP